MEHRADNFFQLSEHLLDTYLGATRDVLANKGVLEKADIDRIIAIMQEYTPKLQHVFTSLCEHCPAYTIARQILPDQAPLEESEIIDFARDSLAFAGVLMSRYDPASSGVWLLDLSRVIDDYAALSRGGQRVLDQRVRKSLFEAPHLAPAFLYLGGGSFVLVFLDSDTAACLARIDAVLEHVLKLTGRASHADRAGAAAGPPADRLGATPVPANGRADMEDALLKRLRDRFDAAVGGAEKDPGGAGGVEPDFAPIRAQISLSFVPVWDARSGNQCMALAWPRRRFPDGSRLSGYRLLMRGRLDPFHNDLQLLFLETAVEAVELQAASAPQPRLCPPVIVGFSLAGLICADLQALEDRITDALAGYAGGKIVLWLQEVDEHIPYRSLVRLLAFLKKKGLRWITDLPMQHPYWTLCYEEALPILVRDAEAIEGLGLDGPAGLLLARHLCKKVAGTGLDGLLLNLQTSPWAEAALHGGARYLSGRIIGEATPQPGLIHDLPTARVLMKV